MPTWMLQIALRKLVPNWDAEVAVPNWMLQTCLFLLKKSQVAVPNVLHKVGMLQSSESSGSKLVVS